jgi:hypothetical protein
MKSEYAKSKLDFLDALFLDFEDQQIDEYLRSHLAKYLTVLISGIYEDVIEHLILELAQRQNTAKELKEFIRNQVDWSFKNPKSENILKFLRRFSPDWAGQYKNSTTPSQRDSLDAIVDNKNLIAHGNSSEITFSDIKRYYDDSKNILVFLDALILS